MVGVREVGVMVMGYNFQLTGRSKELFDIWRDYFKLSVWKNEHLMKRMFLYVAGTYISSKGIKLLYSARYNTPRIHPLFIQDSGSGKSEAMRAGHFMLNYLKINGEYLTKTTDAALMGTIVADRKGNPSTYYGILKDHDYLIWDEGSVLLKSSPYSDNLQDIIQMATDEPGRITKALRLGVIKFPTRTSICAGTFLDSSVTSTILGKGIFQRMLLSYHEVKPEDRIEFNKNKHTLIVGSHYFEKEKLLKSFKDKINELNSVSLFFHYSNGTYYIDYDNASVEKIYEKVTQLTKEGQKAFLENDFRHKILDSFFGRSNQILQIAGIIAALNGKKTVGFEELEIGFQEWREHVASANEILMLNKPMPINLNVEQFEKIKNFIPAGGIEITKLTQSLSEKRVLDMGENNIRKLIDRFINEGKLIVEKNGVRKIIKLKI
jgi:hypothetical protein